MVKQAIAYIGLGSNLDSPLNQIEQALASIDKSTSTECLSISQIYQSKAVGPAQPDYLNAVVKIATTLKPIELLDYLQNIEREQKRVRKEHWGPRTIDLDILLYDDSVVEQPRLSIPHPYLSDRSFVIIPLHDIAPDLILPNGVTIASLWQQCDQSDIALYNIQP